MTKLENLARLLDEWHYQFEIGSFKTERGNFAVKIKKSDIATFMRFCDIYNVPGILEGNNFYCYPISKDCN